MREIEMDTRKVLEEPRVESWLLQVVGCPACKTALEPDGDFLLCRSCCARYGVRNGIPALLDRELEKALKEQQERVKIYYLKERYDWTKDPKALELAYHRYRRWETWRQIMKFIKPGKVILDMGCGTGLITRKFIGMSQRVVALDLNRWALSQMDGKPFIAKIQGDGEALPIQDNAIDLVIATEMMEHMEAPATAAREVYRVCKQGGHVVGSVPSNNSIWKLRHHLSMTCPGNEPFHNSFTKSQVEGLWEKAGFEVKVTSACLGMNWLWILEKR